MTERSSKWGAWLDSTLDRVGDAAVFSGIALWYAGDGDSLLTVALCLYCLSTGAVVSYARARAEGLGMTANVGITERADRLVAILVATGLDGLGVPYIQAAALWLLAVGSTVTIGQRALTVRRQSLAEAP
jgi:CDP-diacylglycerol---glycerol-3-phosphate 3-phosphatidyltransferase